MGFGQAISSGFSNLTNFSGRASRSEFWWWMLFVWIVNVVIGGILNIAVPNDGTSSMGFFASLAFWIVWIIFFLATLAVSIRRLHDTGRTGWWVLLQFICCIGTIILIVFWVQPSQPTENQWGAPAA